MSILRLQSSRYGGSTFIGGDTLCVTAPEFRLSRFSTILDTGGVGAIFLIHWIFAGRYRRLESRLFFNARVSGHTPVYS